MIDILTRIENLEYDLRKLDDEVKWLTVHAVNEAISEAQTQLVIQQDRFENQIHRQFNALIAQARDNALAYSDECKAKLETYKQEFQAELVTMETAYKNRLAALNEEFQLP